jgi:glycosyltransferase involved in cell wall biosynthesis
MAGSAKLPSQVRFTDGAELRFRFRTDAEMSVSIVVPIYNEVENIPLLHEALTRVGKQLDRPYEIVLVNDGSRDGSTQALAELAGRDPLVKVIEFRRNYGQTAAMQAGIQAAANDVVVLLDGDLQNDPADIPMLLAKLDEGYDLVHGWRKNRQDAFLNRKLPSRIANWVISKVTGFPVHDLGCSLKAIRTEIAQELQLYGEMHRFIPILAHWRGARCVEVVTNHHPRRFGTSKYGLSRTTRVILDLLTVKYFIHYVVSPMKLFGMIGLVCGGASALSALATVWMKLAGGMDMTGNPLLLLSAVSAMIGVQFLFLGMLGELCSRIYFEVRGMPNYAIRQTWNFDAAPTIRVADQRRAA